MKSSLLPIILFFTFFHSMTNAQEFKLGKVSVKELEEKVHPIDSTASAAILFKRGKTFFTYYYKTGFSANYVYEFRIKIYSLEGLRLANQQVAFYVGYENLNDDKVRFSKATTYNLVEGKIEKTELNSEGNFKTKINKFWNQATITLPNVKVGSVIEFKYTLESENIVKLRDFDFQYDIPVNFFEYKTEIPEFFIYSSLQKGNLEIETDSEIIDSDKEYAKGYKQINKSYKGQNIPALKNESFVDNRDNYRGLILSELERKRIPDWPVEDFAATWEGVAKTIYKDKEFGDQLKLKDYYSEDLKALLQDISSHKERLNAIFNFVQNKMNWNKKKSYYVDDGVENAYLTKTGNVAEINLMLVSMLKQAGLKANPVLISTIENGIPVFPNRTVFNYVIAAVEIDGHNFLLDATHKLTIPDVLPLNLLNWKGRLIKDDGASEAIDLIPSIASEDKFNIKATINPDIIGVEGTIIIERDRYSAFSFREKNAAKSEDIYIEELENELKNIEITKYKIQNKNEDLAKPIVENFNFKCANFYDVIGNDIYISPLLFVTDLKNPFVEEERKMPIYFGYPGHYNYTVSLEIPQGFFLESMPKSIRIVTENKEVSFTMITNYKENKITIEVRKEINKAIMAIEDYTMLKDFFQQMVDKQNEKIVLKKI